MKLTAWVTLASLLLYFWTIFMVGRARARHGVSAPATDGPQEFMSVMRVQLNTAEQLVLHLPLLWLCAIYLGDQWAAIGGAVWVVGRLLYALGYYRAPSKRAIGFMICILATVALGAGAVIGLLRPVISG